MNPIVDRTRSEHACGSNNAPDDRCVEECSGVRADQTSRGIRCANALNVADEEVVGRNLNDRKPEDSDELSAEHGTGWDFHVMAKFHVRRVRESVVLHHVTVTLKHHHCKWSSWLHITDNELGDNIETRSIGGDGVYHSDWNKEDRTDED